MKDLNWEKLASGRCAKCDGVMEKNAMKMVYYCSADGCNFSISEEKFDKIVNDHYEKEQQRLRQGRYPR